MSKLVVYALVVLVLILPIGAKACPINFSITVSADNGISQADHIFIGNGNTDADGNFSWVLDKQVSILDGFIDSLKLNIKTDPEVGVEFGVRAGSSTTTFSILSTVVSFDPIVNPTAYASAGITLTDKTPSGATITGLFTDGRTNQAKYNGTTAFSNLVSGFTILSGTQTNNEEKGNEFGMITINDTLTSIESNFYFTLTAKDSASGSSNFVVVPEPATMALLGLGGLLLRKRNRK